MMSTVTEKEYEMIMKLAKDLDLQWSKVMGVQTLGGVETGMVKFTVEKPMSPHCGLLVEYIRRYAV